MEKNSKQMEMNEFTSGEYVPKKYVMAYLRMFNWDMSREELIEKFEDIPTIHLSEQDVNKVKMNKLLTGEWK